MTKKMRDLIKQSTVAVLTEYHNALGVIISSKPCTECNHECTQYIILTCYHCVDDNKWIHIMFSDLIRYEAKPNVKPISVFNDFLNYGFHVKSDGQIISTDKKKDLALIVTHCNKDVKASPVDIVKDKQFACKRKFSYRIQFSECYQASSKSPAHNDKFNFQPIVLKRKLEKRIRLIRKGLSPTFYTMLSDASAKDGDSGGGIYVVSKNKLYLCGICNGWYGDNDACTTDNNIRDFINKSKVARG